MSSAAPDTVPTTAGATAAVDAAADALSAVAITADAPAADGGAEPEQTSE
jgi:hypothetical protein